jgi:hypothetical protein
MTVFRNTQDFPLAFLDARRESARASSEGRLGLGMRDEHGGRVMPQTVMVVQQMVGALAPGEWTARACYDIGTMMRLYLTKHPAPPGSELAEELHQWSQSLEARGLERLEELQVPRLRVASSSR